MQSKLTLVSAPAGFGKTTLISEWVAGCEWPVAWLSLDESDKDPVRFLTYLVAALQTISATVGEGIVNILQSPQPPPIESILTILLNEIIALPKDFVLVLDDYHVVDSKPIDAALTFLLDHLPSQMHMVIATREDPPLPLARFRAQGQLTELRVIDLRFSHAEAAEFLSQAMGLNLSAENIAALETRTEGWIAGLQLAALSMQGHSDATSFINSFTGSHHFVLDYLLEEVLQQQPEHIQTFLLKTSILSRLCGSLCDAVLHGTSGQETLEYLERANLFIVSLDNERHWYRYHHLFADLLQQRLAVSSRDDASRVNALHIWASQWLEDNGLDLEAFHHAAAVNDVERAERLIEGKGIPLHFRGAATAILDWLGSLPTTVLDARPSLWWRYGSLMLVNGQTTGVKEKLDAAESALQRTGAGDSDRNLVGRIATARAVLALTQYELETIIVQSRRALEYLDADSLIQRTNAYWTLGVAYFFQGNRIAARQALNKAIALSQDLFTTILATGSLANVQEADNQLDLAAEAYRHVLQLAGDQPLHIIYEAHLGLARILYEWNDLDAAEQHIQQSIVMARQYDRVIDRFIICEVFLARLKLTRGDVAGAAAMLAETSQSALQRNFVYRLPEIAAAQVLTLLRQGNVMAAAHLVQTHNLPISQARVYLAQGDSDAALTILEPLRRQAEAMNWADERLKVMVLQAIALHMQSEQGAASQVLSDALELAQSGGFIRLFVDEGAPMAHLLSEAAARGRMPDYTEKLLAAFETSRPPSNNQPPTQPLIEPLSQRELEILHLIAEGLSNQEIGERLFLALDTVKGHNRKIFDKLQVQRRTEAVACARDLGLI